MNTVHEAVFDEWADRLREDDRGRELIRKARALTRSWPDARTIGSAYRADGQALALLTVNAMIHSGKVGIFRVYVGTGALADRDREGNADALARLVHPFAATVGPCDATGDGTLSWVEPVVGTTLGQPRGETALPPAVVPLEIGRTLASRTWLHFAEGGALARWPYDDNEITVFMVDPDERQRVADRMVIPYAEDPMTDMLRALQEGYLRIDY